MADVNPYPIDDVVKMAGITGFTVWEIENVWTDELLAANMEQYYAGTSERIVNPGQGIQAEDVSISAQFLEGVTGDIAQVADKAGEALGNIGQAIVKGTELPLTILEYAPLVLLAAVGVGLYVLAKKG